MSRVGQGMLSQVTVPDSVQAVDWLAVAPPITAAATAVAVLLAGLWLSRRIAPAVLTAAGAGGIAAALAFVAVQWGEDRATFCTRAFCSYATDEVTLAFQAVVLVTALVVLLLAHDDAPSLPAGETGFLVLTSAAGALVLAAGRDLATIAVALEVVTLPAIALVGLRRRGRRDVEASLTFLVVSIVTLAVMLYGISLVYGATGALHLDQIAAVLADPAARTPLASAGALLTLVGLVAKVGAVPFHFWVPDAHAGGPVVVAAHLSVLPVAAAVVALVEVAGRGFAAFADVWGPVVVALAVATITFGNVAALRQRTAIRLLAWSSVAHAGYLLVPLGVAATGLADIEVAGVLSTTVSYLCLYAVVNLAAFGVVAMASRANLGTTVAEYRGLVRAQPLSAIALGFSLVALAGLPPGLVGVWAKVVVLDAAVSGGVGWLAVVVAVNVVIGLGYYLRWAVLLFAAAPDGHPVPQGGVPLLSGVTVGLLLAAGIVLSVAPELVLTPLAR